MNRSPTSEESPAAPSHCRVRWAFGVRHLFILGVLAVWALADPLLARRAMAGAADDLLREANLRGEAAQLSAEHRGGRQRAGRFWRQVEEQALAYLEAPRPGQDAKQRTAFTWKLADSYRFQQQPDKAIAVLKPLLADQQKMHEAFEERTTLRML